MCGICGTLSLDLRRPVDPALLRRMTASLAHRGPDDEGLWTAPGIGLGNRRLAIIDLSPQGHQPMPNEDGTAWITFNGEAYNFQELRPGLEAAGHRFRSRTDTEVALHLYEERGPAFVRALRGFFALAIWDARRRRLLLARDRLGVKPLYYYAGPDRLVFASEIKAILQDPEVPREIDPEALDAFLAYSVVPAPHTIFRGIRALPPGHTLVWEAGRLAVESYWHLRFTPKRAIAEAEAIEEIRRLLLEATRLRLISDVPLGAFLSGGIDSSAIVACMARTSAARVRTFSIGFDEAAFDELAYARRVAAALQTDHQEAVVRPDAVAILPDLIWAYDQPYGDSSAIPSFYVARMARQHVTVALNGDGGDEAFGGYERYLAQALAGRYQVIPRPLRAGLEGLARAALGPLAGPRTLARKALRFLEAAARPPAERYLAWVLTFDAAARRALHAPEFGSRLGGERPEALVERRLAGPGDPLDALFASDYALYLPDDLLVKMDIATMAHSLEARSPFLDHELVEFAASLPAAWKVRGLSTKWLLRRALRGWIPDAILRRGKMGFGVPLARWFQNELRDFAREILGPDGLGKRGYFRPEAVRALLAEHVAGQADHAHRLWALLVFELWHRTFLDPPAPAKISL
jgi:asparagine synthase (glutamine-hydrolysing)